jgi:hypothetical protein
VGKVSEEQKRLKLAELEEALKKSGWTDWAVIAWNPAVGEYKIFNHMSAFYGEKLDTSFEFFEFILKSMLEKLEERKKELELNKQLEEDDGKYVPSC